MLQNLSEPFLSLGAGLAGAGLLALDLFFAGFVMPLIGGLMQGGQGGIQPLDLMLFATPDEMFAMIEKYGEFGRRSTATWN